MFLRPRAGGEEDVQIKTCSQNVVLLLLTQLDPLAVDCPGVQLQVLKQVVMHLLHQLQAL